MTRIPVGIGTQTQNAVRPVEKTDTSSRNRDDNAKSSGSGTSGDQQTSDKAETTKSGGLDITV